MTAAKEALGRLTGASETLDGLWGGDSAVTRADAATVYVALTLTLTPEEAAYAAEVMHEWLWDDEDPPDGLPLRTLNKLTAIAKLGQIAGAR